MEAADIHAHLFRVTLTIEQPAVPQRLSLPVWIPGSYLVREFSKNLQKLAARQDGRPVALQQLDKCSWQVDCVASSPLVLAYEVYAFDNSVRTAWLDAQRGFFNGTSLCLRVHGQETQPHALELVSPVPSWEAATGLAPHRVGKRGFGTYLAADYDELVDCPVEMGSFWSAEFKAAGVPHRFVVAGAPESFDGARLVADTQKICEAEIHFWHGRKRPPHKSYLFMLNAVDDGYGGLEHRNSTALIAARRELPRLGESRASDGYTTLLGLISHEYFHTWNVKHLRPAEFTHYDYGAENYSQLLWFFEGFTSYYDDLLLRRCGLIDDATYVRLLNKTVNQVLQAPGREVQSVAQASFDAWVKYYRQDENTANATISYYTKGALVALCFDLTLRAEGAGNLDEVMRTLWARCKAGPMTEADFAAVLRELGGRSYAREIAAWVHGTRELPLEELLQRFGIVVLAEPAQWQQRLGLRVAESGGSIQVKTVLRGGAAEQAGFAANDEWLGVEVAGSGWRMAKLDDLPLYAGSHRKVTALVARDRRLLHLELNLPTAVTTWRLVLRDAALAQPWLSPPA
ncbi:protease with the C-terminal PDZ domain-like protein [Ramlibacter tataouinensis TTB310]|uniref:Protease with the C-terminal PDZ domain-like protein n=1 Tax=Ramlibacter tataouinensis (strain ATCC BAA-407 / DSM 14655 / LMG 21543 / TTB310) TaxID=365046 RepID=F5XZI8_RAMTT|nr:protease with the C-terminal PDZ domain-like protein [Ramlibacter tataouinensis TTB310]